MNIRRIIRKLGSVADYFRATAKISYSQFGEDLLVDHIFRSLAGKTNFSYLDIGTNDPVAGNNTYLFYLRGNYGVCIEPDPEIFKKIVSKRKRDVVLHAGIGIGEVAEGTLYIFPEGYTGWNTFSFEEAEKRKVESGISFRESPKIQFLPVNDVIATHFETCPDFISIDVEGLDFDILKSLDFEKYRPIVICAETISFSTNNRGEKQDEIISFLSSKGYKVYADTYVNTIFVRKDIFN